MRYILIGNRYMSDFNATLETYAKKGWTVRNNGFNDGVWWAMLENEEGPVDEI